MAIAIRFALAVCSPRIILHGWCVAFTHPALTLTGIAGLFFAPMATKIAIIGGRSYSTYASDGGGVTELRCKPPEKVKGPKKVQSHIGTYLDCQIGIYATRSGFLCQIGSTRIGSRRFLLLQCLIV